MIESIFDGGVWGLPAWDPAQYFTQGVVSFIAALICLAAGILICFWGYKYLFTLICIVLGCAAGILGISFLDGRIEYPLLNLFLFVTFVFLGECLLYGLSSIFNHSMKKAGMLEGFLKLMILISPFIGAGLIFAVLYCFASSNPFVCGAIALVFAAIGAWHQKKAKVNRKSFHTYDDIYSEVRKDA